jgi:ABC-type dipeptide/oligopeptide/nickel transport system permease component
MLRYIAERLIIMIPTVFVLSVILFVVMRLTPGSPMQPMAANANPLSPEQQANLAKAWGLDKPIPQQYLTYLGNAAHLDFGLSYVYRTRTVTEILGPTFIVSAELGAVALAIAIVVGGLLGIVAAVNQNGPLDYICTFVAMIGVSIPNFVLALFLILLLVLGLHLLPDTGGWQKPVDWIMPSITLALGPLSIIARYTRSSMVDVIRSDYVRTARAKGVGQGSIVFTHILKNALIPPLTILGPLVAAVVTGSPFVELIFRVPGMGRYFITSITARDYPVIMAVFMFYGIFLQLMNLVVDLLYGVADPRIRFGATE